MAERVYPKVPCPDCGQSMDTRSLRCGTCWRNRPTRRCVCADCGGPTRWPEAARCIDCYQRSRNTPTCMDCGKQPISNGARRCKSCWQTATAATVETNGLLARFNAAAFRELLERDEVEWTPGMLAAESGLPAKTIRSWRNGSFRPRTGEWERVARVLALRTCAHCQGSGTVDPTAESIAVVTQAVQLPGVVLPYPEPLIIGSNWALDRNSLALTIECTAVRVTQQEARLLAALAGGAGRFVTTHQLGVLLKVTSHAIHTYLTRLKDKCETAGADLGRVVQNGHGAGYRAIMGARAEVVA